MKKLFSLFALTLVAAISINASAQSLVGKWDTTAGGAQYAMMEAMGGEIEKADTYWNFSSNKSYNTYSYVKATADVMGVQMIMEMEMTESGTWCLSDDELIITVNDFNVSKFNITFSDPSLNSAGDQIKSTMMDAFNSVVGSEVVYDIEFVDSNTVEIEFDNGIMPMSYTLKRVR